jgi:hypothetical protein
VEILGFCLGAFAMILGFSAIAKINALKGEVEALKEQIKNLQK